MSAPSLTLSTIGQIAVNAHDIDRATAFYRDVLGMRFLFQAPPNMAFFDCGGIRLMLGAPSEPQYDHPSSVIYYKVDDIQSAAAALKERQVVFIDDPHLIAKLPDHDLWMGFFRDTEGNVLALMSEVKEK